MTIPHDEQEGRNIERPVFPHRRSHEVTGWDEIRPAILSAGTRLTARFVDTNYEDGIDAAVNTTSRRIDVGLSAGGHGADKHTNITRYIWLPASAFIAVEGSPALAGVGSSANGYEKMPAWAMDGASAETVMTVIRMPADWDAGAVTPTLHWAPSDGNAGNVRWQVLPAYIAAADQIDEANAATLLSIVASPAVADQSTESGGFTTFTPNTPVARVAVRRDGGDATDTYDAHDAWFYGLLLAYTATQ